MTLASKLNFHFREIGGKCWLMAVVAFLIVGSSRSHIHAAAPGEISYSLSAETVEAYDFVEITLRVAAPDAGNPFTEAAVEGQFGKTGNSEKLSVDGFCDSSDGSVFRIRFMPASSGEYEYSVTYRQGEFIKSHQGTFQVVNRNRRGIVRV